MDWVSEYFGGSRTVALTGDGYRLAPAGRFPGSCRYYKIVSSTGAYYVTLPRADISGAGESVVVYNASANAVTLKRQDGVSVVSVSPGVVCETYITDASTTSGQWHTSLASNIAESGALLIARVPLDVTVKADTLAFHLRNHHNSVNGYDGSLPAALRLTITDGYTLGGSKFVGAEDAGLETGVWPTGSTLLVINHGWITGYGGDGGRGVAIGGSLVAATNGRVGGPAMHVQVDTNILNYNVIQGGGGGGGGAISTATAGGGGGGGGAGYSFSFGGLAGAGGGSGPGFPGQTLVYGQGGVGAQPGGNGGAPGQAGATPSSGGTGGAAGAAILRKPAFTVTKSVAGTILGSEGTY